MGTLMRTNGYGHLFVATLAVGIAACNKADGAAGSAAFQQNCGTCHAAGKLPGTRATRLTEPERRIALDRFLAQHHATDPATRRQIIEYLVNQEK